MRLNYTFLMGVLSARLFLLFIKTEKDQYWHMCTHVYTDTHPLPSMLF